MSINEYFITSDLGLAATLFLNGFPLDCLDKKDPHKVQFTFVRLQELDSVIQQYWDRKFRVEPISFMETVKYLKSRIYDN